MRSSVVFKPLFNSCRIQDFFKYNSNTKANNNNFSNKKKEEEENRQKPKYVFLFPTIFLFQVFFPFAGVCNVPTSVHMQAHTHTGAYIRSMYIFSLYIISTKKPKGYTIDPFNKCIQNLYILFHFLYIPFYHFILMGFRVVFVFLRSPISLSFFLHHVCLRLVLGSVWRV